MTWVRIDDHFNEHPKLAAVGPVGWGIWLAGLAYSNRNLTDGFIPRAVAVGFGGDWSVASAEEREGVPGSIIWEISRTSGYSGEDMDTPWVIDRLLEVGLWELAPGGFYIHDYEDYQPTKAEVMARRAVKAAAGQAGGLATARARDKANGHAPAVAESHPIPKPVPKDPKPVPSARNDDPSDAKLVADLRRWAVSKDRQIAKAASDRLAAIGLRIEP